MTVTSPATAARPRALTILVALFIGLAGIVLPATNARAADAPSFAILIDGLCSELASGADVTVNFSGTGGIEQRLTAAGWSAESIVGYSYRGGTIDAGGQWVPTPYGCEDSRDQGLASAVDHLEDQVAALAAAHPGARIHLIGFSQGGLVGFGFLARLAAAGWAMPAGASLASVVTLDTPLGGAPFIEFLCTFAPDYCGGRSTPAEESTLRDMGAIWDTGLDHPAGGNRSIAQRLGAGLASNQSLALTAARSHGVKVMTVGNVRDWLYAPAGPDAGTLSFLDTQWLTSDDGGAGIFARAINAGPSSCPLSEDLASSYGCNHPLSTRDAAVGSAIVTVLAGGRPSSAKSCPGGTGNCLSLPPRPSTLIKATIAAGVVSGGGRFGTGAVTVKSGGRATLLFSTSPAAAGRPVEIWGRGKTGVYRYMTTRVADARGVVRYYTPPITGWAAIQARYAGDYVNGAGVSAGRVVTVR